MASHTFWQDQDLYRFVSPEVKKVRGLSATPSFEVLSDFVRQTDFFCRTEWKFNGQNKILAVGFNHQFANTLVSESKRQWKWKHRFKCYSLSRLCFFFRESSVKPRSRSMAIQNCFPRFGLSKLTRILRGVWWKLWLQKMDTQIWQNAHLKIWHKKWHNRISVTITVIMRLRFENLYIYILYKWLVRTFGQCIKFYVERY